MGANLSTPQKIAKLAKTGDSSNLSVLLTDLQRNDAAFRANRARYLEATDEHGNTPLTAAAARGHLSCVKLLLQFGANLHHVNSKPDGGSALHEAVAHKHEAVVEALLAQGANPFVENCKGFTAMDIACSARNVPLLRRLEQCAPYVGWLLMKVPQFAGLGSSWQRRWVVVSHRYPNPQAPSSRQLTHCVFLAYKSLASTVPSCRAWLDGARARAVYNPKAEVRIQWTAEGGPRVAQAAITLHRKHELPSGVYTTGGHSPASAGTQEGYSFYLRPDDGTQQSVNALDRLIRTVNNRGFPPAEDSGASSSQQVARPGPLYSALGLGAGATAAGRPNPAALSMPNMATTPGTWSTPPDAGLYQTTPAGAAPPPVVGAAGTHSDEEIARRLQEQYDAEIAQQLQQQPSPGEAGSAQPQRAQSAPESPSYTGGGGGGTPAYPPAAVGAAGAAAAAAPDFLTGTPYYPSVHYSQPPPQQPGSAPAAGGRLESAALYSTGSAPPYLASGMQAAAVAAGCSQAGGSQQQSELDSFVTRPSAPMLYSPAYPAVGDMPLAGGLAATQQAGQLGLSASGRHMSAPGLQDDSWWAGQPAVAPSRPASESAAAAVVMSAPPAMQAVAADEPTACVVCMDADATSGVLHGDSVHKCLCKECANMLKESKVENCPMCREHIDAFIMRVF